MDKDVCAACLSYISNRSIPPGVNVTHIVLFPKKTHVETIRDLRPISLCNVVYKIVTKTLANRLKCVLPGVISWSHSAFVPSRAITDNILISYAILHFLNRKTGGKQGFVALKVDMANACDKVEWGFLK